MQEHSDSQTEQRHLSDYYRVVWERRGLVLILFLLTLGTGILFTALQTPVYEATAKVEIQVSPPKLMGGRFEEGTQPVVSPCRSRTGASVRSTWRSAGSEMRISSTW